MPDLYAAGSTPPIAQSTIKYSLAHPRSSISMISRNEKTPSNLLTEATTPLSFVPTKDGLPSQQQENKKAASSYTQMSRPP